MAPWALIGDLTTKAGGTAKGVREIRGNGGEMMGDGWVECDARVVEGPSYDEAANTFGALVWDTSLDTASVPEDGEKYATEYVGIIDP